MNFRFQTILIFLGVFFLFFSILVLLTRSDREDINQWIENNGDKVISCDARWFNTGPYWLTRNYRIYRVTTKNNSIYWFRFGGMLGVDVEQEVPPDKYFKLK